MSAPFVHPLAINECGEVGAGTRIWAFAHVMAGAVVGRECNIGEHVFIESGAVVGHGVTIKNQVLIWKGVTIADGAFIGPRVTFTNDRFPRSPRHPGQPAIADRYHDETRWLAATRVEEGATLGAGAIILPGLTIGRYAMVAAGAVVTRDVLPHALVTGHPAAWRGWVCFCGQPLPEGDPVVCRGCQATFVREPRGIASVVKDRHV